MAKQLRTKTVHDFDTTLELQKVVGNYLMPGRNWKTRGILLASGIAGLIAGAVLIGRGKPVTSNVLIVWGVIALLWTVFFYHLRARQAMRVMKGRHVLVEFVFEKDTALVFQGGRSSRYPYTDMIRLLESERFLYAILNSGQGLMMDKDNLEGGSAAELKAMLEEKCGKTAETVKKMF